MNRPGTGSLYIGQIKWSIDYQNVFLFGSLKSESSRNAGRRARNNFFTSQFMKIKSNIIWKNPTGYVDVNEYIKNVDEFNYIFYLPDASISDKAFCCFITDYEYRAEKCTRIYIECDVWQTYIYDTVFYNSYIKRGIIPKADDIVGYNLESEPYSATPNRTTNLATVLSSADWEPQWVLHCASKFNNSTKQYEYTGNGVGETFGEYGFFVDSLNDIQSYIEQYGRKSFDSVLEDAGESQSQFWQNITDWISGLTDPDSKKSDELSAYSWAISSATSAAELQDHRDELIGLYAIPKWARPSGKSEADNVLVEAANIALPLNNTTMASGYKPRNAKLLSSRYRAYILYAKNGTLISYKPEAFSGTPTLKLQCIPMGISKYYAIITNYNERDKQYLQIPYRSERRVGYDANTGLNKAINVLNAGAGLVNAGAGLVSAVESQNVAGIATGIAGMANSGLSMIDALEAQGAGFGQNGEIIDISYGNAVLYWAQTSPTYNECEKIDNFFDVYGYTINEHLPITDFTNNRSEWDFCLTDRANMTTSAPTQYEEKLKSIFNAGVTIWHNYDNFGNYGIPNV